MRKTATAVPIGSTQPEDPKPPAGNGSMVRTILADGKEIILDFEFKHLAEAEAFFAARGAAECNLLFTMSPQLMNVTRLRALVACAAHRHQPKLTYDEAAGLVTPDTLYPLLNLTYDVLFPQLADVAQTQPSGGAGAAAEGKGAAA